MLSLLRRLETLLLALLFATLGTALYGVTMLAPTASPSAMAAVSPPTGASRLSRSISLSRIEERTFWSHSLQRVMPYLVFVPPGYDSSPARQYPVLYMLHGRNGSYRSWHELGLPEIAERLMQAGDIQPFLIVMPEGENAYWVNHANKGPRWGDYIGHDLVQEIDSQYRTRLDRDARAVGGLSMGGCGALQLGINYSDTFGIVGAHSPAFRTHETAPSYFGDLAYFNAHSPVPLFKSRPRVAKTLKLYIDMGQQDTWHDPAVAFHQQLEQAGIPHQWQDRPGGHDGPYWQGHSPEYLRFYSQSFASLVTPLSRQGAGANQPVSMLSSAPQTPRRPNPPSRAAPADDSDGLSPWARWQQLKLRQTERSD